jgi:hypothetical protein
LGKGTHKACPYIVRKMFAKKTRIYGIAIQGPRPPQGPTVYYRCENILIEGAPKS